MGFLGYVVDTRVVKERLISVSDVPVVCHLLDVFHKDLSGVPPKRQVESRIDLVPGAQGNISSCAA